MTTATRNGIVGNPEKYFTYSYIVSRRATEADFAGNLRIAIIDTG
jgi:hypothetical protein